MESDCFQISSLCIRSFARDMLRHIESSRLASPLHSGGYNIILLYEHRFTMQTQRCMSTFQWWWINSCHGSQGSVPVGNLSTVSEFQQLNLDMSNVFYIDLMNSDSTIILCNFLMHGVTAHRFPAEFCKSKRLNRKVKGTGDLSV